MRPVSGAMVDDFNSTTLIAAIALIGGFIMLSLGIDGEVKAMMGAVIGFYFGRGYGRREITREQEKK